LFPPLTVDEVTPYVFVKNIEQNDSSRTADIISINCFTSVKFQFNPNNTQFNQTFTNCLIKNVTDTLPKLRFFLQGPVQLTPLKF
jgi:hypothetical protein